MAKREITRQEELFLRRVALRLLDTDREPTPENIAQAMREVCARDEEIVTELLVLHERSKRRQYVHGTIEPTFDESPFDILSDMVYHRIRAQHGVG